MAIFYNKRAPIAANAGTGGHGGEVCNGSKNRTQGATQTGAELLPLLECIQAGDQAALGQLYDLTLSKVYGLVLRIVSAPADAEEVTCDVFHQIWRSAKQFDCNRGNPWQWIMVIARSRALDRYRERRQHRYEVHLPEAITAYSVEQVAESHSPWQEFESGSAVQIAIASLSPIQSELMRMAFFQGLTHQEIAEVKQLPLGTVKSHINRAAATLRKTLSPADLR
ncbi:MAG: polymerase sigma factor, sigma-70 family protein [Verrucomicrobiaceae bacterium]|nr:polymerase sigma factor, sigma-70 family protein [Verrucomicrobiaceae bacterium]